MRKYLHMQNEATYIDEDKKTVVHKAELTRDQRALDRINEIILSMTKDLPCFFQLVTFDGGQTIRGKAKCHFEDEFDENRGIEIARAKAVVKATDKAVNELTELSRALSKAQIEISLQINDMIKTGSRYNKAINLLKEFYN